MACGKAAGIDGITTEALQALDEFGIRKLTELCNKMYKHASIPQDLRTSIFIVIPKKPRALDCSDFRTISLMCHTLKLLLTVILKRISEKINRNVSEEQAGFRKNSGTREGIFNIKIIIEKYLEMGKDIFACFIDYSKAFDTVNHEKLIDCLKTIDIDDKDVALIGNLYWLQDTKIRIDDNMSESLEIKRGVRQGCVLSPALFNMYTEYIFKHIEELTGVKIGGRNINNLRYADDTVLLAESEDDLQKIVNIVNEESKKFGLLMNAKKTKTMVFSKLTEIPKVDINIEGRKVEQVQTFTYLGSLITEDGRAEKEIGKRIGIAKRTFQNMYKLITNHALSLKTKIRLTKCYVWSTFLYGCETWTLTSALEKKITSFEMWVYRRISRTPWTERKTNQQVLEKLNLKRTELATAVRKRKLQYFGHVTRHNTLQKTILEGKVEGKRGRGRKRTRWIDNIAAYTNQPINTCAVLAKDRQKWRTMTSNLEYEKEPR